VLVAAGHHVVVAQGDEWRDERDLEVRGVGDAVTLVLGAPDAAPIASATPPASPSPSEAGGPTAPAPNLDRAASKGEDSPDALVWGAAFAMMPAYLLGVTTAGANNRAAALSIVAGPLLEIGYAITDRFEFVGRGFVGIGPDAKPSYAYVVGPGLSYRVASLLWIGATFIGGQLETRAHGVRYGTDQVFGAMLEATFVLLKKPTGEWIASVQPSLLLTEMARDNTALFLPLAFGFRAY
jgi:hypothetical protein